MPIAAHAMNAGVGLEVLLVAIVDQGVQALDGLHPDAAAIAAVAAIRAAILDVLLPAKGHGAAASVAGLDVHLALVEKFHGQAIA